MISGRGLLAQSLVGPMVGGKSWCEGGEEQSQSRSERGVDWGPGVPSTDTAQ